MKNNLLITLMVGLLSCHYFTANALIAKRINNELSNLNREESSNPQQAQDLVKQISAPSNGITEINPVSDLPPQANGQAVGLQKQEENAASDTQVGNKHKLLSPQAKQEITNVASFNSPSNHNPQVIINSAPSIPQAKQEITNVASSNSPPNHNPQVISNSAPSIPQAVAFSNQIIESNPESSSTQSQQSGDSLATSTLSSNLPSSTPVIGPLGSSMLQEQQNGDGVATFNLPSAILPSNSNPQGTTSGSKNDQLVLQAASKSIVPPNNLNNNPLQNGPVVKSSLQNSNEKSQIPTGVAENEKTGRSSFNPELFNPRNIGDNYVADTVSNQNRINSNGIAIGVSVGMLCLAAALLVGYNYKQSKTSSSPTISSDRSIIVNSPDNSSIEDNSLNTDPELLDVSVEFD